MDKIDFSCVPYKRKKLYLKLTIPLLILYAIISIYLATYNVIFAIIYISLYFLACLFQSYCCNYQNCPYIGKFCPGIYGIIPSSIFAKSNLIRKRKKSKKIFNLYATLAFIFLLGLFIFPIYWIMKYSLFITILYGLFTAIYFLTFLYMICPVCAIRDTCPGCKIHQRKK